MRLDLPATGQQQFEVRGDLNRARACGVALDDYYARDRQREHAGYHLPGSSSPRASAAKLTVTRIIASSIHLFAAAKQGRGRVAARALTSDHIMKGIAADHP